MGKRIYEISVKKFLAGLGLLGGSSFIGGVFYYLLFTGAITDFSYSGDIGCLGDTYEGDPCPAYINFTANEDIFLYPTGYDPWGRNTTLEFNPAVKEWKLQRSWGKGWRDIPLDRPCTGTWCGLSNSKDERKFSVVFREGKSYQIRILALKHNPEDEIKWAAFDGLIDPKFLGKKKDPVVISTEYTSNSKTVCNSNNLCNAQIYMDTQFVEEDEIWKDIRFANSLKDKIPLIVDLDPNYRIDIIDYDYDSIDLCVGTHSGLINKDIPLKLLNENNKNELSKINVKLNSAFNDSCFTLPFDFDKEIHWGENSTIVRYNRTDGTATLNSAEGCGSCSSRGTIFISTGHSDTGSGYEFQSSVTFNTSAIPDNVEITEAYVWAKLSGESIDAGQEIEIYSCDYGAVFNCSDWDLTLGTNHGDWWGASQATGVWFNKSLPGSSVSKTGLTKYCGRSKVPSCDVDAASDLHNSGSDIMFLNVTYAVYALTILDTSITTNVSANITVNFNFTKTGSDITTNVDTINITIDGEECSIINTEFCEGTPNICSSYDNESACGFVGCNWSAGTATDTNTNTCTAVWGSDCGTTCGSEADNTYDACSNCDNTDERINEIYINSTVVPQGTSVGVTCEYYTTETTADELYVYYRNSTSGTWRQIASGNGGGSGSTVRNWTTQSITLDNVDGTHQVRCIIDYTGDNDECAGGTYYDNDDANITVASPSSCSGTPNTCNSYGISATCTNNTGCDWNITEQTWYTSGTGWQTNCTVGASCTTANLDLFVEANYTTDSVIKNDTASGIVDCGVEANLSCASYGGSGDYVLPCNCTLDANASLPNNMLKITNQSPNLLTITAEVDMNTTFIEDSCKVAIIGGKLK